MCSVEQCEKAVRCKGVCAYHYFDQYQKANRTHRNRITRERNSGNREYVRGYAKKWKYGNLEKDFSYRLRARYGLTINDLHELLIKQDAKCAICRDYLLGATIHIDHCHATGAVRGVLCRQCNFAIGLFRESKETLASAIAYLERQR